MKDKIWLSSPNMGGDELKYIKNAFKHNWIAPLGPNVDGFEEDICQFTKSDNCVALSSGTAALHLSLILLGVKPKDYVICSSFTFAASANPISYLGAQPIFIDSEPDTWNMSPPLLERALEDGIKTGKKIKAIILVHLYGMPAKIEEIFRIANKYNIPIIEDAAEALGSRYKDKFLGTFGYFGVFSFNGNKIITTSGGGALISQNKSKIEKARFLATQARDDAPHYQHSEIGYNYRMSNIIAGIGRGQMHVLLKRVSQKRNLNKWYKSLFGNVSGITMLQEPDDNYFSNHWLSTILIDEEQVGFSKEELRLAFYKNNIEARPLWKPMHMQPIFEDCLKVVDGTSERLFKMGLCLPSDTNMQEEEKERISDIINTILK